jgi:hypothetical protein
MEAMNNHVIKYFKQEDGPYYTKEMQKKKKKKKKKTEKMKKRSNMMNMCIMHRNGENGAWRGRCRRACTHTADSHIPPRRRPCLSSRFLLLPLHISDVLGAV